MTAPPRSITRLTNDASEAGVAVTPMGPVQRSVGSTGDPVVLRLPAAAWPADFDDQGVFTLTLDAEGPAPVVLTGYRLRARQAVEHGFDFDDAAGAGTAAARVVEIYLDTQLRVVREGRGGLIQVGIKNELDEDGLVDTAAGTYLTTQQLVNDAMDAMGLPHEDCPPGVNTASDGSGIDAPGPLDWGNQRALTEVEGLLFRVGYTLAFGNDGVTRIVRLARAGEPVTLTTELAAIAEPYTASAAPGLRSSKIVVTSGATRTTVIARRTLGQMVWLAFDEEVGHWLTQADWDILHPGLPGPADIAAFRAGLTGTDIDPARSKALAQVFRAVGLAGDDYAKARRFVNLPADIDPGDLAKFRSTPGVVEALCCVDMGGEQFVNAPASDAGPLIRVEGLQTLAREGVFLLPQDAVFLRVDGARVGRRGDMRELAGDELAVVFAHESNAGTLAADYAAFGYTLGESMGSPVLTPMDATELAAAVADPDVVKVAAPWLRRVILREMVGEVLTDIPLNDDRLGPVARQLAWARVADDELVSAVVRLRGIVAVNPGDLGGQVSRVVWDQRSQSTILMLNQHERPGSDEEAERRAIGDSIAAGVGMLQLGRSDASLADVRTQMTADRITTGTPGNPDTNPLQRGRERATAGLAPAAAEGPRPGSGLPKVRDLTRIKARLNTDAPVEIGPNRWAYTWAEATRNGSVYSSDASARNSATHGLAYNDAEGFNAATGVLGNGRDVATIRPGFALLPIGPVCVELEGPYPGAEGEDAWYFFAVNAVGGTCLTENFDPEFVDGGGFGASHSFVADGEGFGDGVDYIIDGGAL